MMTIKDSNRRIETLLVNLSRRTFLTVPHGVGLKTAITVRALGYVEWRGDLKNFSIKLTAEGDVKRAELPSARPPVAYLVDKMRPAD